MLECDVLLIHKWAEKREPYNLADAIIDVKLDLQNEDLDDGEVEEALMHAWGLFDA